MAFRRSTVRSRLAPLIEDEALGLTRRGFCIFGGKGTPSCQTRICREELSTRLASAAVS